MSGRRSSSRFAARLAGGAIFLALLGVVFAETLYLLRLPLVEPLLRAVLQRQLGEVLGGAVQIGRIEGNWWSQVVVRDLRVEGAGPLRNVRDASLELRLDPWLLARGDLAGVRRLHLRASTVHFDLDASWPAAAPEPEPQRAATADLGALFGSLLSALPAGARIDIDELLLTGQGTVRRGHARVALLAGAAAPRRAIVDLPGAALVATLHASGHVDAALTAIDVAAIPHLFTPVPPLQAGVAEGTVALALVPQFAIAADLRVTGMLVRERPVRALAITGRLDALGIGSLFVDLRAPGIALRGRDLALQFGAPLASARGELLLDIVDLEPYARLLPDELRAQLPVNGSLRARAGNGRIEFGDGRLVGRSGELRIDAGAVSITGRPRLIDDAPLRARLQLADTAPLPLPSELPLRPVTGVIELRLGMRADVPVVAAGVDLEVASVDGLSGRLAGEVELTFGAAIDVQPKLQLTGALLRGRTDRIAVDADVAIDGSRVTVRHLRLGTGERDAALTLHGRTDTAAGDPTAVLAASDLELHCRGLPLAAVRPWLPAGLIASGVDGSVTAAVRCTAGALAVELDAAATGLPGLLAGDAVIARVRLALADGTLRIESASLSLPAASAELRGTVAGIDADSLLGGRFDAAAMRPELTFALAGPALDRLDLPTLAGFAVRGGVRAELAVTGTLAAPIGHGNLTFERLALDRGDAPLLQAADGRLSLTDRTVRCDDLRLRVFDRDLVLDGELTHGGDRVQIRTLHVTDGEGNVTLRGELPLPLGDLDALPGVATLQAKVAGFALDPLLALAGIAPVGALLDADVDWQPNGVLAASLDVRAPGCRIGGESLPARVRLQLAGDAARTFVQELRIEAGPLQATGRGDIALAPAALLTDATARRNAALAIDLAIPTVDLGAVPAAAMGFAQLGGSLTTALRCRGTIGAPEPSAQLELDGVTLVTRGGQRLDDLGARVEVTDTAVQIVGLRAARGRGPIQGEGTFTAPGPLWQEWRRGELAFALRGDNVLLHRRAGVRVRADLDLALAGRIDDVAVTGTVSLRDGKVVARVPILDLGHRGGRAATAGIVVPGVDLGTAVGGRFDVRIVTREPIEIANNVANGRLDVALALRGSLAQPVLEGTVSGPDTQLILPGMRLRATTLLVEFRRQDPHFPVLTVAARGRRHGYDVQAVVRGRYDRPQVLLSSDPPLPPDDLVVMVTTGARPEALNSTTGVSTVLGAYLAQELADWIFGSESTEAKESFLDRFTIETGAEMSEAGTESVVVEFRVLDNVYLQGERDVYEDLNMGVVYRLRFH